MKVNAPIVLQNASRSCHAQRWCLCRQLILLY